MLRVAFTDDGSIAKTARKLERTERLVRYGFPRAVNYGGRYLQKGLVQKWKQEFKTLAPKTARALKWHAVHRGRAELLIDERSWPFFRLHIEGGVKNYSPPRILWNRNAPPKSVRKRVGRKLVKRRLKSQRVTRSKNVSLFYDGVNVATAVRTAKYKKRASGAPLVRSRAGPVFSWYFRNFGRYVGEQYER